MARSRKYSPDLENLEIELLLEGVFRHYGFNFQEYSSVPIRRAVWEIIRREKLRTVSGLQEMLLHDYDCMERFLAFLAPSSSSYGPEFYEVFRKDVIPLLRTYPFARIWHAGCASVYDLYTLAILLEEEGIYDRCTLYATDLNETILQKAHDGIFPLIALEKYNRDYEKAGGRSTFSDYYSGGGQNGIFRSSLRKNMVFAQHNLATDGSFNEFNVILCRNVLSLFNETVQARAHKVLYESLTLFGILGLGPRESIQLSPNHYCYAEMDAERHLYRKIL